MTTGFSFNLLDEPWLLVVDRAGANRILGIREALLTAHELVELSITGRSPTPVSQHRFMALRTTKHGVVSGKRVVSRPGH